MNQHYRNRIVAASILSLLGVLLAGPLLPNLPTSSMQADWFWSNKVSPGRSFDVVFVGDSRIYRGISPADFAQSFAPDDSIRVFNFGFSSAGLDTAFLQAGARLLDPHAAQPILVLGITTSSLADENLVNHHFWQEQRRSSLSQWQRKYLNPRLSYFDPTSPSTVVDQLTGQRQGYYQKHLVNGWIASDKYPRRVWENDDHVRRTYPTVVFSQALRQRLLDQVGRWQAQGIQVVAFRPPAAPTLEALEMQPSYYPEAALRAQFRALGGIWLDLTNRGIYKTYDGNHLEEKSARRLSADLGTLLRQALKAQKQSPLLTFVETFETPLQGGAPCVRDATAPSGAHVQALAQEEYSYTHRATLPFNEGEPLTLEATAQARFVAPPDSAQEPILVLSVEDRTQTLLWQGQPIREQQLEATTWSRVELRITYTPQSPHEVVKIYVWNPSPGVVLRLDDLKLEVKR